MRRTRISVSTAAAVIGLIGLVSLPACAATTRSLAKAPARSSTLAATSAQCATNRTAGTVTFVSPFLYDASAGIIDVFAAKALGYFQALCVKVAIDIPSFTESPYELVSTGVGTVTGEGSAADDLAEVANGANLVAISTFGDTSDYALLTTPGIKNLRDLEGKTLGYHTVLPVALSEMLSAAHVDIAKVKEVNDTSYDPDLLLHGTFQGLQAYQSNEPLTLESEGHKLGSAFLEWKPDQFGIHGTFNVQVVNGTFLHKHRSTVADFLRAELRATAYCIAHQMQCVSIEQKASTAAGQSYLVSHARAEWRVEAGLITNNTLPGKGIGVQTTAEWEPEAHAVVAYHLVSRAPDLSTVEDTALVASLYHGKQLIWP